MSGMELSEEVEDELEAVTSILDPDAIAIERQDSDGVRVEVKVTPLTASDKDLAHVGATLSLTLGPHYPEDPPGITIKVPRGLSEPDVEKMVALMSRRCIEMSGCPLVFELVDFAREFLTERNMPAGPCPVCLVSLALEFCKTPCYHYFHSYCLGKSVENQERGETDGSERKLEASNICPVCRESLGSMDVDKLLLAPDPSTFPDSTAQEEKDSIKTVLAQWKAKQRRFKSVYDKQLRKGGIIDLEEEAKRCLVITTRNNEEEGSVGDLTPVAAAAVPVTASAPPAQAAAATSSSKAKVKDEEAGTRQRYKRQPKSRYSHHRHMKTNKTEQGQVINKAKTPTSS